MYAITKLLEKVLLGRAGFDENQIEDIAHARALPEWAVVGLSESQQHSLYAMRDLANPRAFADGASFVETMTTAHFSDLFTDALSRMFYKDYTYQGSQWADYVFKDTAPDFRSVKRFRMTEPEGLELRREKSSHRDTYIQPSLKSYAVEEYSRTFDISWRVIINDDLGKIRETPQRMANAARRSVDTFVSNLYDNATSQAALVALGATYAGTGRLTLANLAIGVNAMKTRLDGAGHPIDTGAIWLVIPPVLEVAAAQVLRDVIGFGGPNSNVIGSFIAGYKVDPYISYTSPNIPWYLIASPSLIPAITLVRLQGQNGPVVAMRRSDIDVIQGSAPAAFLMGDLNTGNIVYLVWDAYGGDADETYGGVTDAVGIYYSSGTTA